MELTPNPTEWLLRSGVSTKFWKRTLGLERRSKLPILDSVWSIFDRKTLDYREGKHR